MIMLVIEKESPSAQVAEIQQLTSLFHGPVPFEYQEFLQKHNGCTISTLAKGWRNGGWMLRFLPITEVVETYLAIEEAYYSWGKKPEPNSFCHVPIATNDNSDYLAYVLWDNSGESYPIYQIDHDDYPFFKGRCKRFRRADNLLDLWNQLEAGTFPPF